MKLNETRVIVVSGMSGSGKTTIVDGLLKHFPKSHKISFDDYDIDALPLVPDITTPIAESVNQYDISQLLQAVEKNWRKYDFLFLDFPFGYQHTDLKPWISKVIYVKTPLDICFARRLLRDDFSNLTGVRKMTEDYLRSARSIFVDYESFVMQDIDLIIDGSLKVSENIAKITAKIIE